MKGNLDVIEDNRNGFLVPYGDEKKLFEAMKELLENKQKAARLGNEGRKTALKNFNVDKIIKQYLLLCTAFFN